MSPKPSRTTHISVICYKYEFSFFHLPNGTGKKSNGIESGEARTYAIRYNVLSILSDYDILVLDIAIGTSVAMASVL